MAHALAVAPVISIVVFRAPSPHDPASTCLVRIGLQVPVLPQQALVVV